MIVILFLHCRLFLRYGGPALEDDQNALTAELTGNGTSMQPIPAYWS